jgi:hypothetical protein
MWLQKLIYLLQTAKPAFPDDCKWRSSNDLKETFREVLNMRLVLSFLLLCAGLGSKIAWAFPEMVRHNYTQCTSCHVSPTGGALLNSYGRQQAAELLSTWSSENEEQFLHSKVGKDLADKGLLFGGDVRWIQTYIKNDNREKARSFPMMANFIGAYQSDRFTAVVSVGEVHEQNKGGVHGNFKASEYYGLLNITDEVAVRAGRFLPAFGVNMPDHSLNSRYMIGFIPILRFDTVEASYLSENWTIIAAAARTPLSIDARYQYQETVRSLNVSYSLFEGTRVGTSYWRGYGPDRDRTIAAAHAIIGFSKKLYNITELAMQYEDSQDGFYGYSKWGYEVFKGLIPYVQLQLSQDDVEVSNTKKIYGLGVQFFPRPHFELSGQWDRIHYDNTSSGQDNRWEDRGFFIAHYYF